MDRLSLKVVESTAVSLYMFLDVLILRLYGERRMRRVERGEDKNQTHHD